MKYLALLISFISFPIYSQNLPFDFDVKQMLILSDADMVPSSMIDGKLKKNEKIQDSLTLILWSDIPTQIKTKSLAVSNSMLGGGKSMEISSNGEFLFVIETKEKGVGIQQMKDVNSEFLDGYNIYSIKKETNGYLSLTGLTQAGKKPVSIDLNNRGDKFGIITEQFGNEICILDWTNNVFGKMFSFPHGLNTEKKITAIDLTWHPSDEYFAVTFKETGQVVFYKLENTDDGLPLIEVWGSMVNVGNSPSTGMFSKDGKYFILPVQNDMKKNGALVSVAFDQKLGNHKMTSTVEVGQGPIGMDINGAGDYIVVSCAKGSYFPVGHESWTMESALSIVKYEAETGVLKAMGNFPVEAIYPKVVAFDRDGDVLVVSSCDYNDISEIRGGLEFLKFIADPEKPRIEKTGFKMGTTKGIHSILLIK